MPNFQKIIVFVLLGTVVVYLFLLVHVFPSSSPPGHNGKEGGSPSQHDQRPRTIVDNDVPNNHPSHGEGQDKISEKRNSANSLRGPDVESVVVSKATTTATNIQRQEKSTTTTKAKVLTTADAHDGMFLDQRSGTWQKCPHLFYMMPAEFEQDGYLSLWTQKTYDALSRAPCRTTDRDAAAVLIPGIETACPINWPHFGNHRKAYRNFVFANKTVSCQDTVEDRLHTYWKRHNLDWDTTPLSEDDNAAAVADGIEHGGLGRGNQGKFLVVFRSGGFSTFWLNNFNRKHIILAHSSLTVNSSPETLNVAYPVMPLTIPKDRTIVGKDPCRPRPIFASFQGKKTWKTREKLLLYQDMPDVQINLAENTRFVDAVDAAVEGASGEDGSKLQEADNSYQADYLKLLKDSVFTFVVRGHNQFSFRFPESIASGSIPIILSDRWHTPFSGAPAIDYDEWSLTFPESEADTLMDSLRALSPERICEMQKALRRVYEEHFETFEAQANTFVTVVNSLITKRDDYLAEKQARLGK